MHSVVLSAPAIPGSEARYAVPGFTSPLIVALLAASCSREGEQVRQTAVAAVLSALARHANL